MEQLKKWKQRKNKAMETTEKIQRNDNTVQLP